ncbi:MAG: hypothetical protein U5R06_18425 [candidate division KSB1 bacterium]|nr:hypothetical protein [candidate division KSB1 bacterium]
MKKVLLLLFLVVTLPAAAEETLFDGHIHHSGGYGGPVVRFTEIGPNSDMGVIVGGRGGWIINHKFILGGGGYGLTTEHNPADWEPTDFQTDYRLNVGYGGIFLGYTQNSDQVLHYTVETMIGWGGVNYSRFDVEQDPDNGDSFFVLEPGVNLEVNVTSFFRVGIGATYRYIQGVDYYSITNEDLSGVSGQIIFRFGSF